jgi:hypothetical protein
MPIARACARRCAADEPRRSTRAQRLEHLGRVLLEQEPHHERAITARELVGHGTRERVRTGDVVRAVEHDQGLVAHDFEPPR